MTEATNTTVQRADDPRLRISVIVPVHDRSQDLKTCLSAILRQTRGWDDVEVLICDDGSSDDLLQTISGVMATGDGPVRYLRQAHQGAGMARNLGIALAKGEILAFTDSDCEPAEDWLTELVRPFDDPSVGLVGGPIDYRGGKYISGRCMNFLMSSTLGAAGARNPRAVVHMQYYPRGGNLAVRTNLARQVGGFPATAHGEDLEFGWKVLGLGVRVAFVPTARVVHHEKRTVFQAFWEAAHKGAARVRLAKRHGMHEVVHALPAILWFYAIVAGILWAARVELAMLASLPGCLYLLALVMLAFQGAICLKSPAAGLLVPVYGLAMHLGYGAGYLVEWFKAFCRTGAEPVVPTHRGVGGKQRPDPGEGCCSARRWR